MLRIVKIAMICSIALWGFIGGLFNILDWEGTMGAVGAATSMATFETGAESWQATSSPVVIWLGALFILLSKLTAAVLCTVGVRNMWQARYAEAAQFAKAKALAMAGCGIAVIMLFGGFIVIAETWFEMWRSDVMRGPVLDSAFRYAGMITLIALFVGTREDVGE